MHPVSRRNMIKSLLRAPVAGYAPFFTSADCRNKEEDNHDFEPGYLKLHRNGELKERGEKLWQIMENCRLCPRKCGANRLKGERGFCGSNSRVEISSFHPHFGEEKPLVGKNGSGTIFMTNCSLRVFSVSTGKSARVGKEAAGASGSLPE
jgi:putative pyruvate formate lyase activating enzyme